MFIQTEDTVDQNKLKFIPGQEVYPNGAEITVENAHQSPLGQAHEKLAKPSGRMLDFRHANRPSTQ